MSKKISYLLMAGLLFLFSKATAYDAKPQGQLEVIVVASGSPDFVKEWMNSSYAHAPRISRIKEVKRDQMFYTAVIVSGFGTDANGNTDLEGDFILLNPDGTESTSEKNIFHHNIDMKGNPGGFVMLDPSVDIVQEKTDPLGTYTIKAVVRDKVLNIAAIGEYKIDLIEDAGNTLLEAGFSSPEDFSKWMTYYYTQPEPAKIPAALKFYADSPIFAKVSSRLPMVAFFAAILKGNGDLMKKMYEDISANGSVNSKVVLLRTLWLVNNAESKQLIDKAKLDWKSDEFNEHFRDILTSAPPDIFKDPIKDATQLDMLWGTFMATGDSAAIKRIISVLHLLKDGHGLDIAIGGAAQWSLTSNAIQHIRVYEICKEELNNADGEGKIILQDIIAKVDAKK